MVESCVGAILLDTGFDLNSVWKIMLSFLDPIMSFSNFQLNPKRELQELCQSRNLILNCSVSKKGVSYSVETKVLCEDECATASVTNLNKQDALRSSAQQVIEQLKVHVLCSFILGHLLLYFTMPSSWLTPLGVIWLLRLIYIFNEKLKFWGKNNTVIEI